MKMQIDHLYGQKVTKVLDRVGEHGWGLTFENGATLVNLNAGEPVPVVLNARLQRAMLDAEETRLMFDNSVVISLMPLAYSISDDLETVTIPQASEIVEDFLPPDPSDERVADGPSQEWLDDQAARAEAETKRETEALAAEELATSEEADNEGS